MLHSGLFIRETCLSKGLRLDAKSRAPLAQVVDGEQAGEARGDQVGQHSREWAARRTPVDSELAYEHILNNAHKMLLSRPQMLEGEAHLAKSSTQNREELLLFVCSNEGESLFGHI